MREVLIRGYGGSGGGEHYFIPGECGNLGSSGRRLQVRTKCARIQLGGTSYEKRERNWETWESYRVTMQAQPWMQKREIEGWVQVCAAQGCFLQDFGVLQSMPTSQMSDSPKNKSALEFLSRLGVAWEQPMGNMVSAQVHQWNSECSHGLEVSSIPVIADLWGVFPWLQWGIRGDDAGAGIVLDLEGVSVSTWR